MDIRKANIVTNKAKTARPCEMSAERSEAKQTAVSSEAEPPGARAAFAGDAELR